MARISRTYLDSLVSQATVALRLEPEAMWIQHSDTGYSLLQRFGAGSQPLGECMTARELQQLLRGLTIGALFYTK
jgi:hypothetical protein